MTLAKWESISNVLSTLSRLVPYMGFVHLRVALRTIIPYALKDNFTPEQLHELIDEYARRPVPASSDHPEGAGQSAGTRPSGVVA